MRSSFSALFAAASVSLGVACSGAFTEGVVPGGDGGMGVVDGGSSLDAAPGADGSSDSRPSSCQDDADCGSGRICGYRTADACAATGRCFDAPAPGTAQCHSYVEGCTCDGAIVNLTCNGYPFGYASRPVAHSGACGSSVDAATAACAKDSDCVSGQLCAFRMSSGCAAMGECFPKPPPGPTCASYSAACTCSNESINVICTQYPSGYAAQPIAHQGACEGGASPDGGDGGTFACGHITCAPTQVCKTATGGAVSSPTTYSCVDFPSQCASKRTCPCVQQALGSQTCSLMNDEFTVDFLYP